MQNLNQQRSLIHWLPTEAREAFLEQMVDLEGAMKATWKQLQVLRGSVRCDQPGAQKTCAQLMELGDTLRSSEEGVLRAASALPFLVPWSPLNPASPEAYVGIFALVLPLTICPWCGVCLKGCLVSPADPITLGLIY